MPEMQTEVDVRQQLGEHGTGVHQVSYQRLPPETGEYTLQYTSCRLLMDSFLYNLMCT